MKHITPPSYARDVITVGIAHFGVGNFHRAHQAVYLHDLLQLGLAREWGICGIGVLPGDARMRDALVGEKFQYTHVERSPDGSAFAQTIGSIVDYLFAPDDPEAVVELLTSPGLRIVSLTITEGGYNLNPATGEFDATNLSIQHDLQPDAAPQSVFGLVIEALERRRAAGLEPFTVMSCDNLPGNGVVARQAFAAFAALKDPALGRWVETEVRFPNSMVDRITPVTSEQDRLHVASEFGATDPWPVLSEAYLQWVLEDDFTLGRPPWELVGVDVVDDVIPYERMKLRLLNASHQALTYFGLLFGYDYVDEAASDPLIVRLLERYLDEEAEPTLTAIPGYDITGYGRTALERFRNRAIRDTLARIATDASDRIATFLVPVAEDGVNAGRPTPMAAAVIASWAHVALSPRPGIRDRQQDLVNQAAVSQVERTGGFLGERRLTGSLGTSTDFVREFTRAYDLIDRVGARAALQSIVADE